MLPRRQKSIGQFMVEARRETFTLPASVGRRVYVKMTCECTRSFILQAITKTRTRTKIYALASEHEKYKLLSQATRKAHV